jgi:hypothetical protein
MDSGGINWGDVPTWVTAAATWLAALAALLTLGAALWAGVVAWRSLTHARGEAEADQARLIGAWLRPPRGEQLGTDLAVVNQSNMPVWDFTVHITSLPSGTVTQVLHGPVLPPLTQGMGPSSGDGRTRATLTTTALVPPSTDISFGCAFWFRDRRNLTWQRTLRGELIRVSSDPPLYPALPLVQIITLD